MNPKLTKVVMEHVEDVGKKPENWDHGFRMEFVGRNPLLFLPKTVAARGYHPRTHQETVESSAVAGLTDADQPS